MESGQQGHLIYLKSGAFDPVVKAKTAREVSRTTAQAEGAGQKRLYLVQFSGPGEWAVREKVESLGAEVISYVPDYAFLIYCDDETKSKFLRISTFRGIVPYSADMKCAPELAKLVIGHIDDGKSPRTVKIIVVARSEAELPALRDKIVQAGLQVLSTVDDMAVVEVGKDNLVALAALSNIASLDEVVYLEETGEVKPAADEKVQRMLLGSGTTGTDYFTSWQVGTNYTGQGQNIGFIDEGVCTAHNAFSLPGKLTVIGGTTAGCDAHGTTVAGIAAGNDPVDGQKGIAHGANLFFSQATGAYGTVIANAINNFLDRPEDIEVVNISMGDGVSYSVTSQAIDRAAYLNDQLLFSVAAGNNAVSISAYDDAFKLDSYFNSSVYYRTLNDVAQAKNAITVCNSGYPDNTIDVRVRSDRIFPQSSRGPTEDGRIKPDICAPGTNLRAAVKENTNQKWCTAGQDYCYYQSVFYNGTSFAAPVVAGGAAIIREALGGTPSSALIKALMINSAARMNDPNGNTYNYEHTPFAATSQQLPTQGAFSQGWGRLNLKGGLDFTGASPSPSDRFLDRQGPLAQGQSVFFRFTVSASSNLKTTIVWTDPPPFANSNKQLVNDLDVKLTAPGGKIYIGNDMTSTPGSESFDRLNNVENIFLNTAPSGDYIVEVKAYNIPDGTQPFALVISSDSANVTQPTVTPSVEATITSPAEYDSVIGTLHLSWDIKGGLGVNNYSIRIGQGVSPVTFERLYTGVPGTTSGSKAFELADFLTADGIYTLRIEGVTTTGLPFTSKPVSARFFLNSPLPQQIINVNGAFPGDKKLESIAVGKTGEFWITDSKNSRILAYNFAGLGGSALPPFSLTPPNVSNPGRISYYDRMTESSNMDFPGGRRYKNGDQLLWLDDRGNKRLIIIYPDPSMSADPAFFSTKAIPYTSLNTLGGSAFNGSPGDFSADNQGLWHILETNRSWDMVVNHSNYTSLSSARFTIGGISDTPGLYNIAASPTGKIFLLRSREQSAKIIGNRFFLSGISLAQGANNVNFRISDSAGHANTVSENVTYTPPQTTRPRIRIISPVNGSATKVLPIYIRADFDNGDKIDLNTVKIFVNDYEISRNNPTQVFVSTNYLPLGWDSGSSVEKYYKIRVECRDIDGNQIVSKTVTVLYDRTPPDQVTVTFPLNGQRLGNSFQTIAGTFQDNFGVEKVIAAEGQSSFPAEIVGNTFYIRNYDYHRDNYSLNIEAADYAGNPTFVSHTLTPREEPLETSSEFITSSAPNPGTIFDNPGPIVVTGGFNNATNLNFTLDGAAETATIAGNSYRLTLNNLSEGRHIVEINGAGSATGNPLPTQYCVFYVDASQPTINANSITPAMPFTTDESSIDISGEFTDTTPVHIESGVSSLSTIDLYTTQGEFIASLSDINPGLELTANDTKEIKTGKDGKVYAVGNNIIRKFSPDGALLMTMSLPATAGADYIDIDTDSFGGIYVLDTGLNRVLKYGAETVAWKKHSVVVDMPKLDGRSTLDEDPALVKVNLNAGGSDIRSLYVHPNTKTAVELPEMSGSGYGVTFFTPSRVQEYANYDGVGEGNTVKSGDDNCKLIPGGAVERCIRGGNANDEGDVPHGERRRISYRVYSPGSAKPARANWIYDNDFLIGHFDEQADNAFSQAARRADINLDGCIDMRDYAFFKSAFDCEASFCSGLDANTRSLEQCIITSQDANGPLYCNMSEQKINKNYLGEIGTVDTVSAACQGKCAIDNNGAKKAWSAADLDLDGVVDMADYTVMKKNFDICFGKPATDGFDKVNWNYDNDISMADWTRLRFGWKRCGVISGNSPLGTNFCEPCDNDINTPEFSCGY